MNNSQASLKVVVTGGAGFIGSHLCNRLIQDGYKVICVDNLSTGLRQNISHLENGENFTFIKHDVTTPLPNTVDKADQIYHLASPASPNHHSPISYHALPFETMMVNTTGTLHLLEFAEKCSARLLFTSTSEIYGDPEKHPQKESYHGNVNPTGPRSVYDEAKRFGETLSSYFARERNVDIRITRIFNTYGPRMLVQDKRMIINFITQALADKPLTVYGEGTQTRSLCYIADIVEGLVKFMNADNLAGEVVNLGSPEEHTVSEYAEIVKKLIGSKGEITYTEKLPKDDPMRRCPDISKAKKLLNWQPTTPLKKGLKKTIEYFKT